MFLLNRYVFLFALSFLSLKAMERPTYIMDRQTYYSIALSLKMENS